MTKKSRRDPALFCHGGNGMENAIFMGFSYKLIF